MYNQLRGESIVKVEHKFNNYRISGQSNNVFALLSNNKGAYFSITNNLTHYQGFSISKNNTMFKLLDSINFNYFNTADKIENSQGSFTIFNKQSTQSYFLSDTLLCDIENFSDYVSIDIDMRFIDSSPEKGRIYSFEVEDNMVIVKYEKYTDNTLSEKEYEIYLGILIKGIDKNSLTAKNNWISKFYKMDSDRGYSGTRYVNRAINFMLLNKKATIIFAHGKNKTECEEKLHFYSKNEYSLRKNVYEFNILKDNKESSEFQYLPELNTAVNSLNLNFHTIPIKHTQLTNLFAGWPWFFQFWTRDTLISVGSLILLEKYDVVKNILNKYLKFFDEKGLLNSRIPFSELKSIDSTGWFFKRYYDLLFTLSEKNILFEYYTYESLEKLRIKFERIIDNYIEKNMKNNLIYSGKNETWMDTDYDDSGRTGYCIEIQALSLAIFKTLRLLYLFINIKFPVHYSKLEENLLKKVHERFHSKGLIADYVTDEERYFIARPNLFIARYVYPHLFSDEEWKTAFDYVSKRLWLEWGGFSSIDKTNKLFTENHSGQNNKSYHRGDSWFFVNNMAAIQLYLVDNKAYSSIIDKIFDASINDMYFNGVLGSCSEISSAAYLKAEGCLNQTWSSAMLIELIFVLNKIKLFNR